MNWIKDVSHELKQVDLSKKSLAKFGLIIGGIFLLLALLFFYKNILITLRMIFAVIGLFLFIGGIIFPEKLSPFYKIWMGFAFALGWIISRFILTILFIFVLTPVGLLAKLFGKRFLELKWRDGKQSYWINKQYKKIEYEKMY